MDESKISELNSLAASLGLSGRVKFYNSGVLSVVRTVAPFSRVAVIYSEESYAGIGKAFTEELKKAEIKPLNFIVPPDITVRLNSVFDAICVPEGVRAVVCFDRKIVGLAAYIATLFKIPVVYGMRSPVTEGVIPAKVPFSFGDERCEKTVAVNCEYHIAVGLENAGEKAAEQYLNLVAKGLALIDYRAKVKISGANSRKAACDAINSALSEIVAAPENTEKLAFYGLKTEIADLAARDEITGNGAFYSCKRLTGFNAESGAYFLFLKKLAALYLLCASNGDMPFTVPDYNARAAELALLTGADDGIFLQGFLAQKRILKTVRYFAPLKSGLKKDIAAFNDGLASAEKTYLSLGGKLCDDFSPYVKALKYCGDLPDTLNFMTFVRESGFAEFD